MNAPTSITPPYKHTPLFPLGKDTTAYRKLTSDGVRVESMKGHDVIVVEREAMRALAEAAFTDINHLLRPGHLKQLRAILDDPQASDNDRFVAYDFLKNANIAAGGVLPMCQDTGTAIIMGKKGRLVFTDGDDEAALAEGARDAYLKRNLRYSQLAPISMFEEKNTKSNMPAQVEIYAEGEDAYKLLFIAKGGGSANKSFLFQATPSILTHDRMIAFLKEKVLTLGTAACPPYHLAIVIGGTSAELTMKTVKLVEVGAGSELDRLHGQFGRRAADDDGEMVGRTRGGTEREHLLLEERDHAIMGENRRGRLEQKRFVGGAAALGDEQELVCVVVLAGAFGVDLDLRRHVRLGVLFLEHGDRRELRIAQVALEIGVARARGERGFVVAVGEDQAARLAHDDGGAGVLAHGQYAAGGDIGILEEIVGDELVVVARLRVLDDGAQLLEVPRAQQMVDIGERRLGEQAQRLALDDDELVLARAFHPHAVGVELTVGRPIGAEREQRRMLVRRGNLGVGCHGRTILLGSFPRKTPGTGLANVSRAQRSTSH